MKMSLHISNWRNLLIMAVLICFSGCRYPFDLNDSDMESLVAVQSYICADSTVSIHIYKTVPLTQIGKADTTLINPRYSLKCNGREVEVRDSMIGEGGMALIAQSFKSGDKVELAFETEDMKTAVASTTIPDKFPEYSLKLTGNSSTSTRTLQISYKDNPETEDWYGAIVKWQGNIITQYGENEYSSYYATDRGTFPPSSYDDFQIEPEAYSPLVIECYYLGSDSGEYLYFWKDSDEEDNIYDLMYNYRMEHDYTSDRIEDREIQCTLFKLSEEMYRFLFAQFDRYNNPFQSAGLSSPAFTYSNVADGLGYFCGYSAIKSEWIKDEIE